MVVYKHINSSGIQMTKLSYHKYWIPKRWIRASTE